MTLSEQADALEAHIQALSGPREELSRIVKTLRFLAKPHIEAAIREAHEAEKFTKQVQDVFPGAERVK